MLGERLPEPLGLPQVGVDGGAMRERVDALGHGLGVAVHDEAHARFGGHAIAHLVHGAELPGGVDVQERERRRRREEGLLRDVQHDRAVLAHRVEHHRVVGLGDRLPHDVNAFGLEPLQVSETHR